MGYIQELETPLKEMLAEMEEEKQANVIKFVKEKVWESYRNGQKAAKTGAAGKKTGKRTGTPARENEEA